MDTTILILVFVILVCCVGFISGVTVYRAKAESMNKSKQSFEADEERIRMIENGYADVNTTEGKENVKVKDYEDFTKQKAEAQTKRILKEFGTTAATMAAHQLVFSKPLQAGEKMAVKAAFSIDKKYVTTMISEFDKLLIDIKKISKDNEILKTFAKNHESGLDVLYKGSVDDDFETVLKGIRSLDDPKYDGIKTRAEKIVADYKSNRNFNLLKEYLKKSNLYPKNDAEFMARMENREYDMLMASNIYKKSIKKHNMNSVKMRALLAQAAVAIGVADFGLAFAMELLTIHFMGGKITNAQLRQSAINAAMGFAMGAAFSMAIGAAIGAFTSTGAVAGAWGMVGVGAGATAMAGPAAVVMVVLLSMQVLDIVGVGNFMSVKYNSDLKNEKKYIDDAYESYLPKFPRIINWANGKSYQRSGEVVFTEDMDQLRQKVDVGGFDTVAEGEWYTPDDHSAMQMMSYIYDYLEENNLTLGPNIVDVLTKFYESRIKNMYANPIVREIANAERNKQFAKVKKEYVTLAAIQVQNEAIKAGFYDISIKLVLKAALAKVGVSNVEIRKIVDY